MRHVAWLPCLLLAASPARANITLGAVFSRTGPGAGLGIPERDAVERVQAFAGTEAVFMLFPADHSGAETSSHVIVAIRDGDYRLLP